MPKGEEQQDPLGNYIEWAQHRYDPGHYLGGTIEPHLRKSSLGHRARRRSGIMLFVSGLAGLLLTAAFAFDPGALLPEVVAYLTFGLGAGVSLLTMGAGVSMFRAGWSRRRSSKTRRR